jgi:hypothetical protein
LLLSAAADSAVVSPPSDGSPEPVSDEPPHEPRTSIAATTMGAQTRRKLKRVMMDSFPYKAPTAGAPFHVIVI